MTARRAGAAVDRIAIPGQRHGIPQPSPSGWVTDWAEKNVMWKGFYAESVVFHSLGSARRYSRRAPPQDGNPKPENYAESVEQKNRGTLSVFKCRMLRFLGWRIRCRELLTPGCGVQRLQRIILPGLFPMTNPSQRCATGRDLCIDPGPNP